MHDAAVEAGLGPDRLCFLRSSTAAMAPGGWRSSPTTARRPSSAGSRSASSSLVRIHPGSGRIALTAAASARWSRVRGVVAPAGRDVVRAWSVDNPRGGGAGGDQERWAPDVSDHLILHLENGGWELLEAERLRAAIADRAGGRAPHRGPASADARSHRP